MKRSCGMEPSTSISLPAGFCDRSESGSCMKSAPTCLSAGKAERQVGANGIRRSMTCPEPVLPDQCFLYPHFGQTPSIRATPQSGQRSIVLPGAYSCAAALTPLVKVIFAMLSLSFSRS